MWGLGKIVSAFVRGGFGNGWRRVKNMHGPQRQPLVPAFGLHVSLIYIYILLYTEGYTTYGCVLK